MSLHIKLHPFFSVYCLHAQDDSIFESASIAPLSSCRKVLLDMHLVFRPMPFGASVYYTSNENAGTVLGQITRVINLDFVLAIPLPEHSSIQPNLAAKQRAWLTNKLGDGTIQESSVTKLHPANVIEQADLTTITDNNSDILAANTFGVISIYLQKEQLLAPTDGYRYELKVATQ